MHMLGPAAPALLLVLCALGVGGLRRTANAVQPQADDGSLAIVGAASAGRPTYNFQRDGGGGPHGFPLQLTRPLRSGIDIDAAATGVPVSHQDLSEIAMHDAEEGYTVADAGAGCKPRPVMHVHMNCDSRPCVYAPCC